MDTEAITHANAAFKRCAFAKALALLAKHLEAPESLRSSCENALTEARAEASAAALKIGGMMPQEADVHAAIANAVFEFMELNVRASKTETTNG